MKITVVAGGRWHAFDLARELHAAGHLHRLVTNYPKWFAYRWGVPKEKICSLPLTFWIVKAIYKIGGERLMMRCQWRVHRWFAERAVRHLDGSELVHGWSQWSEPSLIWAKKRGIPTVLERSSAHILEQSRLLSEEHRRLGIHWTETHQRIEAMELREYALCNKVAVPSLFVERSFIERGFPSESLYRNALGVDLSRFHEPSEPPSSPEQDGLKVIYAGTLSVRKGIPDLLAGFRKARLDRAQLTLVGGMTSELATLFDRNEENVAVLGHRPQSELVKHYGRAHCFVMASIEEGMAMVQMQALACGLPLICTTNTGGEDLLRMRNDTPVAGPMGIQQFPAGFVIPIHSPAAIAWCLEQMPGIWEQQREAALEIARSSLDWNTYGKRSIELYEDLLA